MNDRVLSTLSLATKAGKTVGGEMLVEKAVKEGNGTVVIVSQEASANTKKKFTNMCMFYHVPIYIYGTKEQLGHFTGKEFRASVALMGMEFYNTLVKALETAGIQTNQEVSE